MFLKPYPISLHRSIFILNGGFAKPTRQTIPKPPKHQIEVSKLTYF
jgi:hypothetical protein